jgi:hypothetical protein
MGENIDEEKLLLRKAVGKLMITDLPIWMCIAQAEIYLTLRNVKIPNE